MKNIYRLFKNSTGIATDSRRVKQGAIYVSLKGERFNGNAFAQKALDAGAIYAIVDESEFCVDNRCILVKDALKCLQALSNFHRKTFDIPIIAITGSNGKTTTKELISTVLNSSYHCHYTKGNFNNHIGVPLTLLEMPESAEVAVIEMGANHQGEIAQLCEIAEPTHGVITNIGKAHLEGFGGEEGVKKGKSELYKYLAREGGVAFVNLDAAFLDSLSKTCKYRILYKKDDNFTDPIVHQVKRLEDENGFIRLSFSSKQKDEISVNTHIMGDYNFQNIMSAITIGKYFRVSANAIKQSIQNYIPSNNRSQIVEKGTNTYFLDAYNANPTSMEMSIRNFAAIQTKKNKVLILGEMKELGEYSKKEHQDLLDLANALGFKDMILVGKAFDEVKHERQHFPDAAALNKWIGAHPFENAFILVKGSRSNHLESIIS